MSEPASQRLPANQVGLIFALLLAAWLIFIFFPRQDKPNPPVAPAVTESKLRAVGLPDNADFEGLPEFFAVWAEHAQWQDNQTAFAYWNPGSQSYSYFIEATRLNDAYRFRIVSREGLTKNDIYYYHEVDENLTKEVPEIKSQTDSHPFVFLKKYRMGPAFVSYPDLGSADSRRFANKAPTRVEVDLKQPPLTPSLPVNKELEIHGDPKK